MKPTLNLPSLVFLATSLAAGCALDGAESAGSPEGHEVAAGAAESLTGPVRVSIFWGWFGADNGGSTQRWDGLVYASGASMSIVGDEQMESDDRTMAFEKYSLVQWASSTRGDTDGVELMVTPESSASRVLLDLRATGIPGRRIELNGLGCEPVVIDRDSQGHRLYVQRECDETPTGAPELDVQVVWGSFAGNKPAPATWTAAITTSAGAQAELGRRLQMEYDDRVYAASSRIAVRSTTAGDVDGLQITLKASDWAAAPTTTVCFTAAGTSACAAMKDLVCNQLYTAVSETNGIFLKGNCPDAKTAANYAPKGDSAIPNPTKMPTPDQPNDSKELPPGM